MGTGARWRGRGTRRFDRSPTRGSPPVSQWCWHLDGPGARLLHRVGSALRLGVGQFEVDGDLPIAFDRGGATLAVAGAGSCTIEASIGGSSDRASLDVRPVATTARTLPVAKL